MKPAVYLLASLLLIAGAVNAQNWPQFRGPNGQGHSAETGLPLKWSATENIAWRTELPGESWSSPIVWGDRVFVTAATDAGVSCRVIAIDRKTGAILWNREVFKQTSDTRKAVTVTPRPPLQRMACLSMPVLGMVVLRPSISWDESSGSIATILFTASTGWAQRCCCTMVC